jgi:myosin heavy subunit
LVNLKSICVIVLTASFSFMAIEAGLLERQVRLHTISQFDKTVKDLDESSQDLDKLVFKMSVTVDSINSTAVNEQKFLATESREFLKTTAAIKQIIVSTDYNLNSQENGLLPKLNASIDQQNTALLALQKRAQDDLAQAQIAIDALPPIEKNISDTSSALSLAVTQVSPEIVTTTKNLNATSADVKEVADAYKQKLLHPLHSAWHDFTAALSIVVSALEVHAFWP